MAIFKVNPATVPASGLNFRSAPAVHPSTLRGILNRGDFVESLGPAEIATPVTWLQVRVLYSLNFPSGTTGYVAQKLSDDIYLVETSEPVPTAPSPTPPSTPISLVEATAQVATIMNIPALLLKAFMGVEGANVNHSDGVLQVTAGTRPGVISRITRANKLTALGLAAGTSITDADLNTRFAQAFTAKNLVVQIMTGAQYINEQLNRFNNLVVLAGLAYNAGPGGAQSVINGFGGDPYHTALQYHKQIGTGKNQVTVQPGQIRIDGSTGVSYTYYPVTANDTGKEIPQYLYLRQVPKRNYGLLDFIFQPALLASRKLYENDQPPGSDLELRVMIVSEGTLKFVAG